MSEPRVLAGREAARALEHDVRIRSTRLGSPESPLTLAIVRVGSDPAAEGYGRQLLRTCKRVGIGARTEALAPDASLADLGRALARLGADPAVHGILVQTPLPRGLSATAVARAVPPSKDVDCISPEGLGLLFLGVSTVAPATAAAVDYLLAYYGIALEGRLVVVIGRSNSVGKPVAHLMLQHNATVSVCHSRTPDVPAVASKGDVLIVAVGRKHLVDARYVKPGAVVVDVGTNYEAAAVYGDVNFDAVAPIVSAITPVPGGIGPLTNLCLLQNLVTLAERAGGGGSSPR
ncbi:MAG: bifunctional 5,10-methylenetetrahydrofolate dehydrogenase/5,10-methenyltetrahydrofolate cyclohydrolase [Actinobacteria bacterium]|nr:bifunctional 5,10-methylenetetrahydrofolate dehydrogenase/5,10-methenyltetrahydrofolate cyclohydrolase [Actinomycetota bacterium]